MPSLKLDPKNSDWKPFFTHYKTIPERAFFGHDLMKTFFVFLYPKSDCFFFRFIPLVLAGLCCYWHSIPAAAASPQLTANEQSAMVGDSPENPGSLADSLSAALKPADVQAAMRKVADWQLARVHSEHSQDWTFATLYLGMLSASETLHDPRYSEYVQGVANHYEWTLGPRKSHADDQAIGQSYLWLYNRKPEVSRLTQLRTQFDEIMRLPDDPQKPVWWWCDALFMAPPVWTELASITHQDKYIAYMDREWHITSDLLWDRDEHLFYRDSSFFDKREKNGKKIFWSRGNGWVMGGLVRVLATLPQNDPRRPFYVEKFRQMAEKARTLQSADGLWRPGLLDEAGYPYPEISGSSFFVYAMAWGINNGLLDKQLYRPVVERGWKGIVAHIYADGRLGSIQPVGAAPGAYTQASSYVFGTGAFLLAGSQVELLSR
jgi:rhamnogalacturonyl hydrolase YesR